MKEKKIGHLSYFFSKDLKMKNFYVITIQQFCEIFVKLITFPEKIFFSLKIFTNLHFRILHFDHFSELRLI